MVYEISTVEDFINFWGTTVKANTEETSEMITGKLMNHIDFIGTEYALNFPSFGGGATTSSYGTKIYNVTFDGNNKSIRNFSKVASETYYALFGEITLYNSVIKDLWIDNAVISCRNFIGIIGGSVNTTFNNVSLRNFNVTASSDIYLWGYFQIGDLFYKCAMVNSTLNAGYQIVGFGDWGANWELSKYKYCVSNVHFIAKKYIYNYYSASASDSSYSGENGIVQCCISKDIYEGAQNGISVFGNPTRRGRCTYFNYCYCASRFVNCTSTNNTAYHIFSTSIYYLSCYVDTKLAAEDGCNLYIEDEGFKATTSQLKDRAWLKERGWIFA